MILRLSGLLLLQAVGAVAAVRLAGAVRAPLSAAEAALAGAVVGGLAWFVLDALRGVRMLRWLRKGAGEEPPFTRGPWGEAADRVRRLLRQRDKELAVAQQRLQDFLAAIQASPNGVILLDPQGRIEWCNAIARDHLGIDAQRDLLQLVGNLVRDPVFTAYVAAGDYARDVVLLGPTGTPSRPVRVSVQLHPYGEGRKLLLTRDVTALEQAETMRRDFVANVSHEIRTPLTVLAGFVETLQTLPLEPRERQRYLGLMAQQSQRMQTLVNDLLTLSRLEGSRPPGAQEWIAAGALALQCEQEARGLGASLGKRHELRFAPPPPVDIGGAPAELQSALSNLVSNAVRYTPTGGIIAVEWRTLADGGLEVAVRDTGPGIAAEHLPRLTERFYRVDRSRSRETGGTGLGLAIVKHVAQRHGAELRIASTPGAGSIFSIVLPAHRVRTLKAEAASGARRATGSPAG